LVENRDFFHALHSMHVRGSRRIVAIPFVTKKKLERCGYPMVKKVWGYVEPFWQNTGVCQTDRRTRRRTSCDGKDRAMHSIAR